MLSSAARDAVRTASSGSESSLMSAWIASVARRSPRRLTAWTRMSSGRLRSPAACSSRRTDWRGVDLLERAPGGLADAFARVGERGDDRGAGAVVGLDAEGGDDADADRFGLIGLKGFEEDFQRGLVVGRDERGGGGGALLRVVGAEQARPFAELFLAHPLAEGRERGAEEQEGGKAERADGGRKTWRSSADFQGAIANCAIGEFRMLELAISRMSNVRPASGCIPFRRTRSSSSFILAAARARRNPNPAASAADRGGDRRR